ncbi:MAG: DinB family protein [candidate division Zixibacteria bacterium]|nr:DinB family protein [candidate division Zixibacteria bacterium]
MKRVLWRQSGAAVAMLENAVHRCPEDVWRGKGGDFFDFWYLASHTAFWLDYYLAESTESLAPPPPFDLEELDPTGALPPRVYTQAELLELLRYGRERCHAFIQFLTPETLDQDCGARRPGLTNLELLLYTMRHVQHHAAQLNLMLRQRIDSAPSWVGFTKARID